jgi:hypothetical protein
MMPDERRSKLHMELIPEPLWGRNVRSLHPELWDELREDAYRAANYHCQICRWASEPVIESERKVREFPFGAEPFILGGRWYQLVIHWHHAIEAHEVFEYEIDRPARSGIQRLARIEAICRECHYVKHWQLTTRLFERLEAPYGTERPKAHCLHVNGWTEADFEEHKAAAFAEWEYRNTLKWTQDLSLVQSLTRQNRP